MARSLWKGPFCEIHKNTKRIWSRRSVVVPECLHATYLIHTGKTFLAVKITEDMIGHKFGEFASTRRKARHKVKTNKKTK